MFVFAVILASANAFGDAFTSPDSLLPGHDYKTIKGADWLNCLRTCIAETRCLSYNYFKATNGQDNICEMNDRAMDNSCDAKGHLISSPGWLYNQVKRNVKVDRPGIPSENHRPKHPPDDVRAYNSTLTSIVIQWDAVQPQGGEKIDGYRLTYKALPDGQQTLLKTVNASLNFTKLTLEGLEEFTKYNICVLAYNAQGRGPMSCTTAETAEGRPGAAPDGVQGDNATTTSILVKWGDVHQADRNGVIQGYRVKYKAVNESKEFPSTVNGSEIRELHLEGLEVATRYNICVLAFTAAGDGPMVCIEVTTAENPQLKSYKSCKEAYDAGERDDKAYELQLDDGETRVYCHMSPIPGCGSGGGYTLVMKIDGSARTFLYDSALWTNRIAYNVPGGSSLNASEETKLPTYWETPFSRICLGMTVAGQTNYLAINYTADSLYALIADGQYRATTLGRDAWKALISGSSLQVNCNKEGFNALPRNSRAARARIGITSNNENDCDSNDSRIGFGTGGWKDPNDSCGNSAYHGGDNRNKSITAFGYVFVQRSV